MRTRDRQGADGIGRDYTDRAYWSGIIKMSLSKFFVLCVLQRQSLHGYAIARSVERISVGCCSPTEGTLYPVLHDFEKGGYVTAREEVVRGRRRKVYTITERGRRAYAVALTAWMEVTDCLRNCAGGHGEEPAASCCEAGSGEAAMDGEPAACLAPAGR